MIKVKNVVPTYDDPSDTEPVVVESHWNESSKVVLTIGAKTVTVVARDLEKAIANATNSGRW